MLVYHRMQVFLQTARATLSGQLFFGQLNLACYFMQIRLDLEGFKI